MPYYKHNTGFTQTNSASFDKIFQPGDRAVDAGIYVCTVCGHEIGIAREHVLPSQSHGTHSVLSGPIRWQLRAAAIEKSFR